MRHLATPKTRSFFSSIGSVVGPAVLVLSLALLVLPSDAARAGEGSDKVTPTEDVRIELGRRLFFDAAVSPSGKRSCASCHDPDHGFSDPARLSVDDFGMTSRHSQPILNTAHDTSAHWDGEFRSVEDLVKERLSATPSSGGYGRRGGTPFTGGMPLVVAANGARIEKPENTAQALQLLKDLVRAGGVGRKNDKAVASRLSQNGRYKRAFERAFGRKDITLAEIATCLSDYCKTIESTEAPFDRFLDGDEAALSASAKRGHALFAGRAGCAQCHVTHGSHPLFRDHKFHNTGIAWLDASENEESRALKGMLEKLLAIPQMARRLVLLTGKDKPELTEFAASMGDQGRHGISNEAADRRAFKTPTLRDVAKRGPYMHNGRFETLADVVRYYAAGCGKDPDKDALLKPFEVTDRDVADLVAFLESLTGDERPGLAETAWSARTETTHLRFVDAAGNLLTGLDVRVEPAGDVLPGKRAKAPDPVECVTDRQGWIGYSVPLTTHARISLAEGLVPVGGDLVPDTCDLATIKLPITGRMQLEVSFPDGAEVADAVYVSPTSKGKAGGLATLVGPDGEIHTRRVRLSMFHHTPVPAVKFVRTETASKAGRKTATYEGWVRSDFAVKKAVMTFSDPAQELPEGAFESEAFDYSPKTVAKIELPK